MPPLNDPAVRRNDQGSIDLTKADVTITPPPIAPASGTTPSTPASSSPFSGPASPFAQPGLGGLFGNISGHRPDQNAGQPALEQNTSAAPNDGADIVPVSKIGLDDTHEKKVEASASNSNLVVEVTTDTQRIAQEFRRTDPSAPSQNKFDKSSDGDGSAKGGEKDSRDSGTTPEKRWESFKGESQDNILKDKGPIVVAPQAPHSEARSDGGTQNRNQKDQGPREERREPRDTKGDDRNIQPSRTDQPVRAVETKAVSSEPRSDRDTRTEKSTTTDSRLSPRSDPAPSNNVTTPAQRNVGQIVRHEPDGAKIASRESAPIEKQTAPIIEKAPSAGPTQIVRAVTPAVETVLPAPIAAEIVRAVSSNSQPAGIQNADLQTPDKHQEKTIEIGRVAPTAGIETIREIVIPKDAIPIHDGNRDIIDAKIVERPVASPENTVVIPKETPIQIIIERSEGIPVDVKSAAITSTALPDTIARRIEELAAKADIPILKSDVSEASQGAKIEQLRTQEVVEVRIREIATPEERLVARGEVLETTGAQKQGREAIPEAIVERVVTRTIDPKELQKIQVDQAEALTVKRSGGEGGTDSVKIPSEVAITTRTEVSPKGETVTIEKQVPILPEAERQKLISNLESLVTTHLIQCDIPARVMVEIGKVISALEIAEARSGLAHGINEQVKSSLNELLKSVDALAMDPSRSPEEIAATQLLRKMIHEALQDIASREAALKAGLDSDIEKVSAPSADDDFDIDFDSDLDSDRDIGDTKERPEPRTAIEKVYDTVTDTVKRLLFSESRDETPTLKEDIKPDKDNLKKEELLKRLLDKEKEKGEPRAKKKLREETLYIESDVVETHSITGRVISGRTGAGISGVTVYGGMLGNTVTDEDGAFEYSNIPEGTGYTLGPDKPGYEFKPGVVHGVLQESAHYLFTATREPK